MNPQATLQRAFAAHQAGNLAEAEFLYKAVLAIDKNQFDAVHMLGLIEGQRGNYSDALRRITKALRIQPNSAEAHANLGRVQGALEDFPRAAVSYKKAVALKPGFALAHNNFSAILRRLKRNDEALVHCDKAIAIEPNYTDAWTNRGNVFFDLLRYDQAFASYNHALALDSKLAEAYLGRANVLKEFKRLDEALVDYDRALAINPHLIEATFGRGVTLNTLRRFEEAFIAFDKVFSIKPDYELVEGERLAAKMHICSWQSLNAERSHLISSINSGAMASTPFCMLGISESPAVQLTCTQRFAAAKYPAASPAVWQGEKYKHDRVRVTYLSPDFGNHPVAHLLAGVIEHHDRARLETIAISFGVDRSSPMRRRLQGSFERFIDVENQSDADVARLMRELEVDIAVDLMGYTANSRFAIFASRPAPVQVSYLGYAATTGVNYIDYILADRCVIPKDEHRFYSEKPVYLPDTFMAADSKREISKDSSTRAEQGLPEAGFVFCAFGQHHKITPEVFSIWMRLLKGVEGSVLWLSKMNNDASANNLRREAAARDVNADRLIFASSVEKNEDHLARHRLADLFLGTQPYNAHATAVDSLWAGLPVLSSLGSTLAARVSGSVLHAAGLSELVTASMEEYEALAFKIARDPSLCKLLKDKLASNRDSCMLFNTQRLTRHIEAAYTTMWERTQRGEAPQSFAVEPIL